MAEEQLSEALSALVEDAVQRLIGAGVGDSLAMAEELHLLRQQNDELQAALEVDDVELSRLYGVLGTCYGLHDKQTSTLPMSLSVRASPPLPLRY